MSTKSTIELIILGILQDKPMNAYELTQYTEKNRIERLLKISKPSIYKVCKKLSKEGFLSGKTVREGENPEKIIYSVTKKGKSYFYELMKHFSGSIQPYFFDFNCFIWNLEKIEKKEALDMLKKLENEFSEMKKWILIHEKEVTELTFPIRMIVKQYRMTISTLLQWITETLEEYKGIK